MYSISLSSDAEKTILAFRKSNPTAYKKVIALLDSISKTPREGIGHPEPLRNGDSNTYSRRIDKKNRLVYDIYDDVIKVLVLSAEGHYSDK